MFAQYDSQNHYDRHVLQYYERQRLQRLDDRNRFYAQALKKVGS